MTRYGKWGYFSKILWKWPKISWKRLFLPKKAAFGWFSKYAKITSPVIFCKLTMWRCVEEMTALGISSLKTQSPYLTSLGGRSHFADILQIGRKTFKKRIFLPKNTFFPGFGRFSENAKISSWGIFCKSTMESALDGTFRPEISAFFNHS